MNFIDQRLNICRACPEHRPLNLGLSQCQACGCVIQMKAVVPWAQCPKNLWPKEDHIAQQELDDILINDEYIGMMKPTSAYKTAVHVKFTERFGPDADVHALWQDLVDRRSRAN